MAHRWKGNDPTSWLDVLLSLIRQYELQFDSIGFLSLAWDIQWSWRETVKEMKLFNIHHISCLKAQPLLWILYSSKEEDWEKAEKTTNAPIKTQKNRNSQRTSITLRKYSPIRSVRGLL